MKGVDRLQQEMRRARAELEDVAGMTGERVVLFSTGLIAADELDNLVTLLKAKRSDYDRAQRDYLAQVPY